MRVSFDYSERESTEAYARATVVVDGENRGLITMPKSMWDYFLETIWDGHARLEASTKSLTFEKDKFSDASVKITAPRNEG